MLKYGKLFLICGGQALKVVIACLNAKYVHVSPAPWCLFAGVKKYLSADVDAKVMECTINSDTDKFSQDIIKENPDIVSFSCYIWNIKKTLEIAEVVKQKSNAKVILGGPEVSYRASGVLNEYSFIDFVLSGEGEETFSEFLDAFYNKKELESVAGLTYRSDDKIFSNPEKTYSGTPPTPYTEEFFENLSGRISYIETSRGCPYRCAFCLSGRCSDLRFFDIERVKEDILNLCVSGTKTIKFLDRTFNAKAERANEILRFILDNYKVKIPEGVCFHFEIAGDILTEETLDILKNAPNGLFQLEIGMQSFNEATLKAVNRRTNTQKLIKNIKRLVSFGNMHIHIDLIAGLTGEDLASFRNSFNKGYSLNAHMLQLGFLKLLHGADMREFPEKYPCEFSTEPPYEVIETPWLTNAEIQSLKKCEDALERLYNSGRFLFTLDYLIGECGFEPFDLFLRFGSFINGTKMNLSDYAVHLYEYFSAFADEAVLKEKILCDLLACSSALQIPEFFKIKSPLYKQAKKYFTQNKKDKIKIAVLNTSQKIYVVNQSSEKDLRGRYEGCFYDFSEFDRFLQNMKN